MEKPILPMPLTEQQLKQKLFYARVLAIVPLAFIAILLCLIVEWLFHVKEIDPLQIFVGGLVVVFLIVLAGVGADHLWNRCFAPLPERLYKTILRLFMYYGEFEVYRQDVVKLGRAFNYADLRTLTLYSQKLMTWEFKQRDLNAERRDEREMLYRKPDDF